MCHLCSLREAIGEPIRLGRQTLFRILARFHRRQRPLHLVVSRVQPQGLGLVLLILFCHYQSLRCAVRLRPYLNNQALVRLDTSETLFLLCPVPLLEAQH
jgi:hypothetical protein